MKKYIVPDTRQQAGKHDDMHAAIDAHSDITLTSPIVLPAGDYMALTSGAHELPTFGHETVDTKQHMTELCACLTRENRRFVSEFKRAAELGVKLYIVTIDPAVCRKGMAPDDMSGVWRWVNPRVFYGKANKRTPQGPQLAKAIHTIEERYCAGERRFLFARTQAEAGELIIRLLYPAKDKEEVNEHDDA